MKERLTTFYSKWRSDVILLNFGMEDNNKLALNSGNDMSPLFSRSSHYVSKFCLSNICWATAGQLSTAEFLLGVTKLYRDSQITVYTAHSVIPFANTSMWRSAKMWERNVILLAPRSAVKYGKVNRTFILHSSCRVTFLICLMA